MPLSPWAGTRREGWEIWWAWHPVMIRRDDMPGKKVLTVWENVWRRRVNGRWEYDLVD